MVYQTLANMEDGKQLSKQVLSMRFMKRKEEAEIRAKLEEEQIKSVQDAHWVAQGRENEAAVGVREDQPLVFSRKTGRKSFGKFNPTIESLNKQQSKADQMEEGAEEEEEEKKEEEEQSSVTAIEMAGKLGAYYGKARGSKNKQKGQKEKNNNAKKKRKI